MKTIKFNILFLALMTISFPLFSLAIGPGEIPRPGDFKIPSAGIETSKGLLSLLAKIVGVVWKVFFIIAVLFILVAAFDYLTAHGNEETIKKAHQQLTYAAIAIVIALLSVSAEVIIQNFLGEQGGGGGFQKVGDIYNEEYGKLPNPDTRWQPYQPSQGIQL